MRFTFILDYAGGTYIDQLNAPGVLSASRKYCLRLRETVAVPNGQLIAAKFELQLAEGASPLQLDGLFDAWCVGVVKVKGQLGNLNVVGSR